MIVSEIQNIFQKLFWSCVFEDRATKKCKKNGGKKHTEDQQTRLYETRLALPNSTEDKK